MKDGTKQPLRGDAAWRAAKDEIAKRNDAVQARGAAGRAANEARVGRQRAEAARVEAASTPDQPRP